MNITKKQKTIQTYLIGCILVVGMTTFTRETKAARLFRADKDFSAQIAEKPEEEKIKRITFSLIDTLKVTSKTTIVGKCHNQSEPYDFYSFQLKDSALIVKFKNSLIAGKQLPSKYSKNAFEVRIIENYKVINCFRFDPVQNSVMCSDARYKFDFNQLKDYHLHYPIICEETHKNFENIQEFETYKTKIEKDSNLLYYNEPCFKYEGNFVVLAKISALFQSPKAVLAYLQTKFEEIEPSNKFSMAVELDLNVPDPSMLTNHYTVRIECSKKLYENYNDSILKKQDWNPYTSQTGFFYFKK
ncbi:MAG: hypothetical protein RIS29_1424 [Bacteroidota bacterium]|jgi:hypothetical protein